MYVSSDFFPLCEYNIVSYLIFKDSFLVSLFILKQSDSLRKRQKVKENFHHLVHTQLLQAIECTASQTQEAGAPNGSPTRLTQLSSSVSTVKRISQELRIPSWD